MPVDKLAQHPQNPSGPLYNTG